MLGICYGHQLMARALGGEVEATGQREYGGTTLQVLEPGVLLRDLAPREQVWMSHGDAVTVAPQGFRVTSRTEQIAVASMEDPERGLFAVQFHPEVAHTPKGTAVMKRFLYDGCGLLPEWTPANVIERSVAAIRAQVGDAEVLCALSGGVDSAVAALLVHKAVGDRLTCVFVDTGLLREGEPEQVEETFGRHFRVPLVHVKAADRFLAKLAGVTDPEDKRKRDRRGVHPRLRGGRARARGGAVPGPGHALPRRDRERQQDGGQDQEPSQRRRPARGHGRSSSSNRCGTCSRTRSASVGAELGLPEEIVQRQPFPGPGLAVRIVGEVTAENLRIVRAADHVVREEIRRAGLDRETWQAFCVLLAEVRSVGVMGDGRTYEHPVILRAVTSEDAMTADWARLPHEVLDKIASRVVREVPGVNRVAYDVTSKPPGTIEWE